MIENTFSKICIIVDYWLDQFEIRNNYFLSGLYIGLTVDQQHYYIRWSCLCGRDFFFHEIVSPILGKISLLKIYLSVTGEILLSLKAYRRKYQLLIFLPTKIWPVSVHFDNILPGGGVYNYTTKSHRCWMIFQSYTS